MYTGLYGSIKTKQRLDPAPAPCTAAVPQDNKASPSESRGFRFLRSLNQLNNYFSLSLRRYIVLIFLESRGGSDNRALNDIKALLESMLYSTTQ
jgi:hypothetical protein